MRRLARVAVASVAVTLTLAYLVGAAAVVARWSPSVEPEPATCGRSSDPVGSTVTVTDL